jgi:hypothetical protein
MKPIRVNSDFATPYDTARILGVSKARTEELIKMVRVRAGRTVKNGASPDPASKIHPIKKSSSSSSSSSLAARKSRVRNAGSRVSAAKTKTAKANRQS